MDYLYVSHHHNFFPAIFYGSNYISAKEAIIDLVNVQERAQARKKVFMKAKKVSEEGFLKKIKEKKPQWLVHRQTPGIIFMPLELVKKVVGVVSLFDERQ